MYTHSFPMHLVRALAPPRFAAGVLVTLALLSACSDSAPRITSPPLPSSPRHVTVPSSGYTVLANAAVTCTNSTIIGDIGTNLAPTAGSYTNTGALCPLTADLGTAAAIAAYNAFVTAYGNIAALSCDFFLTGTLAGITLTVPGVYCFTSYAALTGTLTLDGPSGGQWIFKIGTSGTGYLEATNFSVVTAEPCNVTWWVDEYAEVTTSTFQGNILAGTYVTLTGSTSTGNAWSQTDVTLTGSTLTGCANVPTSGGGGALTLAGGTDHFACYETTDQTRNAPIPITLDDQFAGERAGNAMAALYFCNPVAKTVGVVTTPIDEPNGHLIFYALTQKRTSILRTVVINNQFGQDTLGVSTPQLVTVPTLKNGEGIATDLDLLSHFACYVVAGGGSLNVRADLQDQFFTDPQAILVREPKYFCNPAEKTRGEEDPTTILTDEDHLVCYKVTPSVNPRQLLPPVSSVTVENQFEGFNLDPLETFKIGPLIFLCVPSEKLEFTPA